jgi:cytidylate kinase
MSIQFYGWDPRETTRYDLVVNTGTLALDTCVEIIAEAARIKAGLAGATAP